MAQAVLRGAQEARAVMLLACHSGDRHGAGAHASAPPLKVQPAARQRDSVGFQRVAAAVVVLRR